MCYVKKLQSLTVDREKLRKTLSYIKAAFKMLVKLALGYASFSPFHIRPTFKIPSHF